MYLFCKFKLRKSSESIQISLIFIHMKQISSFFQVMSSLYQDIFFIKINSNAPMFYIVSTTRIANWTLISRSLIIISIDGWFMVLSWYMLVHLKLIDNPHLLYDHKPEFYILFFYEIIIPSESNTSELKSFSIVIRPYSAYILLLYVPST